VAAWSKVTVGLGVVHDRTASLDIERHRLVGWSRPAQGLCCADGRDVVLSFDRFDLTKYSAEIIADVDKCHLF
jgi:hypothetical protein